MFLKIAFVILLILAQQRLLKVKSMLFLIITSLALSIIAAFLIGFVPGRLASITDAIAGIIDGVAGFIWPFILFLMSLVGVLRSIRVDRGSERG